MMRDTAPDDTPEPERPERARAAYNPRVLERLFLLSARGATVRGELLGGVTTFATMAYIVVVNPAILSYAGIPSGPSTVATALTAAFGTLLMGLYANRPIAVAPYMGENAFVAFGLAAIGATWPQMLGAVFVSGLVFLAVTLLGVREWLAEAVSPSLKHAFAVGIGLFLALIGLYESGVVTSGATGLPAASLADPTGLLRAPATPLKIGDVTEPRVLLAVLGFLLIGVLVERGVKGALLLGMAATAACGALLGLGQAPRAVAALPFTGELSLAPLFLELDVVGVLRPAFFPALLTLVLMGFLDTLGTLVGVGAAGGMLDERGRFPDMRRPMLVDAASCVFAGCVGTTTSGAYIESAAGIRAGARTGLASVVTAALFLGTLIFVPLLQPLQQLRFAYAPALVAVGVLMLASVRRIEVEDLTELIPAFASIVMMVFTYNVANGLTAGLVLHPLLKAAAGRWRELRPGGLVLAALCASYYLLGLPH
jgi:AGZA family xanthine/uracil permease-like MFS transporter